MSSFGFRFYFNRRRQWIDVHLHDVTPDAFYRYAESYWGYYVAEEDRRNRVGKFGNLHFVASRVTHDNVAHELMHAYWDRIFTTGIILNTRNEERLCKWFDEMTRNFWREYRKVTE